jgi:hypothetical protein
MSKIRGKGSRDLIRKFTHTRVRIQRGQMFVAMISQTLMIAGLYHGQLPVQINWWVLVLLLGVAYLVLAWSLGYIDDRMHMARMEQGWYAERNPQLIEIRACLERLEKQGDQKNAKTDRL